MEVFQRNNYDRALDNLIVMPETIEGFFVIHLHDLNELLVDLMNGAKTCNFIEKS